MAGKILYVRVFVSPTRQVNKQAEVWIGFLLRRLAVIDLLMPLPSLASIV